MKKKSPIQYLNYKTTILLEVEQRINEILTMPVKDFLTADELVGVLMKRIDGKQ